MGDGIVYCSDHLGDDAAQARLLDTVEGEMLIGFKAGRCERVWERNCIALSLAGGFVEPLESTSIHLIMIAPTRLLQLFPYDGVSPAAAERFNAMARRGIEGVRDFIVLHHHLNERPEPFWRRCREMAVPDSMAERIALFAQSAQAYQASDELFRVTSWVQVMLGQRLRPASHNRLARMMPAGQLSGALGGLHAGVAATVARLPQHQAFLDRYASTVRRDTT